METTTQGTSHEFILILTLGILHEANVEDDDDVLT